MGLDIRLPIGFMFTLIGAVLAAFGAFGDKAIYNRSLGYNVNLWWGIVLLIFGLLFLYYGRRGTSAMRPAETTPEGQAMEAREQATVERDVPRGH
ncbi:MAG TPA: hypothetical protein VF021_09350 [Longimicrobiales bacterium]